MSTQQLLGQAIFGIEWTAQKAGVVASTIGIMLTFSATAYVWWKNLTWNRAELSSRLITQWDLRIAEYRRVIERHYGDLWNSKRPLKELGPDPEAVARAIPVNDNQAFSKERRSTKDLYELRNAAIHLLNWFEDFAALYRRGALDRTIIDNLLKKTIQDTYDRLWDLKKAFDQFDHAPAWRILDELIADWASGNDPRPIRPIAHG